QWPPGAEREPYERSTDATGRFELPADERSGVVCAWHEDWGTAGLLSAADPTFDGGFVLQLFHPWPHASGRVLDAEGAPVRDATVTLEAASEVGRTIATRRWGVLLPEPFGVDADGTFEVPSMPLGTYWIRAEAPGLAPCAQVWTPVDEAAHFEFTLTRGRTLEGRLTLDDGRPAAGAHVAVELGGPLGRREVPADSEGRFELAQLPSGPLEVCAAWSDGEQGWLARGELVECALERLVWNAELFRGGTIRGWALRSDDSVPEGWSVRAVTDEREAWAELDEFGGFLVAGWDAPWARLELRDRARDLRALAVWRAGMPEVELLEDPGRLVGDVRFHDPRHARSAHLRVRHVETDDELEASFDVERGRLDVGGLAPGDWRLLRWLPGRRTDEVGRFRVHPGRTTDFGVLEVPALARLAVDVGGERGGHVRLLRRLVDGSTWPEAERRVSQADADGMLTFEVPPDAYEVRIGGITSAARSYPVVLAPAASEVLIPEPRELVDCVLRVRRPAAGAGGGLLDLRVLDPRLGIEVILQRRPVRADAGRDVEFEVALPPGEWLLRASSPEGRVERAFQSDALEDGTVFELRAE
ncbi:MAG TPA: carboxypeptidase-like regulatory domain-containing protein, partial [Planctomycetota bacterium]|nr:carboxypeptidase-like regulatory domain-containing protein [Planctomycetota bacterium]